MLVLTPKGIYYLSVLHHKPTFTARPISHRLSAPSGGSLATIVVRLHFVDYKCREFLLFVMKLAFQQKLIVILRGFSLSRSKNPAKKVAQPLSRLSTPREEMLPACFWKRTLGKRSDHEICRSSEGFLQGISVWPPSSWPRTLFEGYRMSVSGWRFGLCSRFRGVSRLAPRHAH